MSLENSGSLHFLMLGWTITQGLIRRVLPAMQQECGLDLRDLLVLTHVRGGVVYPTHLAEDLQLPKYVVSRTLEGLMAAGLVTRSIDERDSRRARLSLTLEGERRIDQALRLIEREVSPYLSGLGADTTVLLDMLQHIADQVRPVEEQAAASEDGASS
ncbi:DNA-binding MarR family transcriptional regulator [Deinobacterium chartae]|uniref:DNA-binding MarR family transcriptional regulator n=1 Tax=Deinobacterium chartae TaxID=521158 RepID=A0A841HWP1_9DEIO|nr:MarR family winged helix-turn-helix transcriptional regulator [Deinobacterium chartae]MBB6097807.1 DNA-binding MarR family transcriptional regulator [Deinobacterium chartae]